MLFFEKRPWRRLHIFELHMVIPVVRDVLMLGSVMKFRVEGLELVVAVVAEKLSFK